MDPRTNTPVADDKISDVFDELLHLSPDNPLWRDDKIREFYNAHPRTIQVNSASAQQALEAQLDAPANLNTATTLLFLLRLGANRTTVAKTQTGGSVFMKIVDCFILRIRDDDPRIETKKEQLRKAVLALYKKYNHLIMFDQADFAFYVDTFKPRHESRARWILEWAAEFVEAGADPARLNSQYIYDALMKTNFPHNLENVLNKQSSLGRIFRASKRDISHLSTEQLKKEADRFSADRVRIQTIAEALNTGRTPNYYLYEEMRPCLKNLAEEFNWKEALYCVQELHENPNARMDDELGNLFHESFGLTDLLVLHLNHGRPFPNEIIELLERGLDPNLYRKDIQVPLKTLIRHGLEKEAVLFLQFGAKPALAGDEAFDFLAKWLLKLSRNNDITPLTPIIIANIKDHKLKLLEAIKRLSPQDSLDVIRFVFENKQCALSRVCLAGHTKLDKGQTSSFHAYYQDSLKKAGIAAASLSDEEHHSDIEATPIEEIDHVDKTNVKTVALSLIKASEDETQKAAAIKANLPQRVVETLLDLPLDENWPDIIEHIGRLLNHYDKNIVHNATIKNRAQAVLDYQIEKNKQYGAHIIMANLVYLGANPNTKNKSGVSLFNIMINSVDYKQRSGDQQSLEQRKERVKRDIAVLFNDKSNLPIIDQQDFERFVNVFKIAHETRAIVIPGFAASFVKKGIPPHQFDQQYIYDALMSINRSKDILKALDPSDPLGKIFRTAKRSIEGLSNDELTHEAKKFTAERIKITAFASFHALQKKDYDYPIAKMIKATIDSKTAAKFDWDGALKLIKSGANPNEIFIKPAGPARIGVGLTDVLTHYVTANKSLPRCTQELLECGLSPNNISQGMKPILEVLIEHKLTNDAVLLLQYGADPSLAGERGFDFLAQWLLDLSREKDITPLTPIIIANIKDHKLELLKAIKKLGVDEGPEAIKYVFDDPDSALARVCLAGHTDIHRGKTEAFHQYYQQVTKPTTISVGPTKTKSSLFDEIAKDRKKESPSPSPSLSPSSNPPKKH